MQILRIKVFLTKRTDNFLEGKKILDKISYVQELRLLFAFFWGGGRKKIGFNLALNTETGGRGLALNTETGGEAWP